MGLQIREDQEETARVKRVRHAPHWARCKVRSPLDSSGSLHPYMRVEAGDYSQNRDCLLHLSIGHAPPPHPRSWRL